MLKSNSFQKFQYYWIMLSVVLLSAGIIILFAGVTFGKLLLGVGLLSVLIYIFVSFLQWFKFKKGEGFKNLITAYFVLSILMILSGLVGAFLTYPDGMTIFLAGLGMLGGFWIIKLIQFIFMKEEDFKKSQF